MDYCRRKVLLIKDKLEQLSQLVSAAGCLLAYASAALYLMSKYACASGLRQWLALALTRGPPVRCHASQPNACGCFRRLPPAPQVKQRQAMLGQVDALLDQRMGEQQAAGQQAAAGPAAAGQNK